MDRTAEFLSTVQSLQRQASIAAAAAAQLAGSASAAAVAGALPPLTTLGLSGPNAGMIRHRHTPSFNGTVDSVREPLIPADVGAGSNRNFPQQSKFAEAASHIGRSIFGVTEKLEKLTKLARERSLFNDPAAEINELTFTIKRDIQTLDKEIGVLATFVADNLRSSQANGRHSAASNQAIVQGLKTRLATTTKSFADVLQMRTKNMREKSNRRKQFESASSFQLKKRSVDAFGMSGLGEATGRAGAASSTTLDWATGEEIKDDGANSLMVSGGQLELMQEPQEDQYYASRAAAIQEIEKTIVEVGQMYKELVTIVGMQEELTLRIDDNLSTTLQNLESGTGELVKLNDSHSNSGRLLLKIFAIILFFLLLAVFLS